jgi:hypothetical protein
MTSGAILMTVSSRRNYNQSNMERVMTANQKSKLIEKIKSELVGYGFSEDSYGNYVNSDKTIRYKFSKTCLRKEKSWRNSDNILQWSRVRSGYYSNLSFSETGKLVGLK